MIVSQGMIKSLGRYINITPSETWEAIKNLCNMATKNSNNFKRVLNGVWNGLCWCGNVLVKMGQGIMIAIALLAMTIFIYNPLVFVPLAFIKPRKAANLIYDTELDWFTDFWKAFYAPLAAMLPFYAKQHFMAANGIYNYSPKLQVKFVMCRFRKPEQIVELVKELTDEAVNLFWQENQDNWLNRQCVIRARKVLSDEQFQVLTIKGDSNLAQEYVERHTPSEAMLKMMLDAQFGNVFYYCVVRYGLSSAMVNYVYQLSEKMTQDKSRNEFRKGLVVTTQEALQHFADRQMVRNTQNSTNCEMWIAYLKEGNRPCVSAQKIMTPWQYGRYHEAGLVLASSVVEYFLSRADLGMCVKIFEYEDKEKFTDKAKSLIKANPVLMQLWLSRR